jgi:putative ABC transport system permease protein
VQGSYFQTLGIALERGRFFSEAEHAENRQVAIVSRKLADRFWPGQDPIGKRLKRGTPESPDPWMAVVGVVADTAVIGMLSELTADDRPIRVYEPIRSVPDANSGLTGRFVHLAVLAQGDPSLLASPVRGEIESLDPQLAVTRIAVEDEELREIVAPQRFSTQLVAAFAGGALLLVAIGLYGLLAFTVAQRTREIGVRIALGAEPPAVVGMVLRQGLSLIAIGLALGLAAALVAARLLQSFLYEIGSYDVVTFLVVPLVLAAVAMLACWLPARRAARVDPLVALRAD